MKLNINSLIDNTTNPRKISWWSAKYSQFTYITTIGLSYPELVMLAIDPTVSEKCFVDITEGRCLYRLSCS